MDHTISLSDKQDGAAQSIVDNLNKDRLTGQITGTLTIDKWMKQIVIGPIKFELERLDALKLQPILTALPDATNSQINQIKTILGV